MRRELAALLARDGRAGRIVKEEDPCYDPSKFFLTNNEQLGRFQIAEEEEKPHKSADYSDKSNVLHGCKPNPDESCDTVDDVAGKPNSNVSPTTTVIAADDVKKKPHKSSGHSDHANSRKRRKQA